ncbi:hypothetical protein RVR34_22525 [Microcystis aeruginosa FBCC-A68]|uniref:hypothetical protein n=1 Tax=Microcystis aeruginosa TaxID=1126 RepID=UPI001483ABB2|nr:hypothetical protein [Microcystis aeruginosa]
MWGIGKETSFVSGGENFFIGTDSWLRLMVSWDALKLGGEVGEWGNGGMGEWGISTKTPTPPATRTQ